MHHMRKLIAKHMKESLATSAHVYVMTEVDMTSIVDFVLKEEMAFKDREGFNLTYTPFIVDAVVRSLKDQPEMNSSIFDTNVNFHRDINIGLAVAIENGLMVPNMANCEEKNFLEDSAVRYMILHLEHEMVLLKLRINWHYIQHNKFWCIWCLNGHPYHKST